MRQSIYIRSPVAQDCKHFIKAMKRSICLHDPWVFPPIDDEQFNDYLQRINGSDCKGYLVMVDDHIAGVFNINGIMRGSFQSAYLGYFAVLDYAGRGLMSKGLKLVLNDVFTKLTLHRIEANIQPDNLRSINLVARNGFCKEGYSPRFLKINDQWKDHERWAITYEDWQEVQNGE
jgi:[ribosomal protein S5]-alanine N-acetyltransferase